jgi:glycosyltransferase involved in cell wall biosynthesis
MEVPLTIAIPVFDRSDYFAEAVTSALRQNVSVPVMVIDNASTKFDFEKAVRDLRNPKVSYLRNPANLGMVENWNQCLERAATRWVSILHDDDVLYPNAVEWLSRAIAEQPGRALYFGLDDVLDEQSRMTRNKVETDPVYTDISAEEYAVRNQFCACGFVVDRERALAIGGYDRRLQMAPDWDLYSRLCVRHGAVRVNRIIGAYRESVFRESATGSMARRGVLLPSMTLQRGRNLRDYTRVTGKTLAASPRDGQAEMAQRILGQVGYRMNRRGRRTAFLYAVRSCPANRWKALAYRLSPGLFCWLMVLYSCLGSYAARRGFARR